MARRLAEWREDEARRQNRPLRQVLRDDLLVAIAKRQPTNRRDLEALRDFNRPALLNRSEEILAILDEARRGPGRPASRAARAARRAARPLDGRQPALRGAGAVLRAEPGRRLARGQRRRSQAPGPLAPRGGRDESHRPALLQGWRGELCGALLLDVLEGRLALRVVDPASEFPVALEPVEAIGCQDPNARRLTDQE